MCQSAFIWWELSLCRGNIFIYKLNLHFRRLFNYYVTYKRPPSHIRTIKVFECQNYAYVWWFPSLKKLKFYMILTVSVIIWWFRFPLEWHRIHCHTTKCKNLKTVRSVNRISNNFRYDFFANGTISWIRTQCHYIHNFFANRFLM